MEDRIAISELGAASAVSQTDALPIVQADGATRKATLALLSDFFETIYAGGTGPAGDSAYSIWLSEGNTGTVADFLVSLIGPPGTAGPAGPAGPQGPVGPSATTQYPLTGTSMLFSGDIGTGDVSGALNGPGVVDITIPDNVNNFSITIPSEFIGVTPGSDSCTVNFQFSATTGLFNRSELTMRYPAVLIYGRGTEDSGGFDVAYLGNNPQRRHLPFDALSPGLCSVRLAGMSTVGSDFTLTFIFG